MISSLDFLTERFARAITLLDEVKSNLQGGKALLGLLGWDLPPGLTELDLSEIEISILIAKLDDLAELQDTGSASDIDLAMAIGDVAIALAAVLEQIDNVAGGFAATPEYLNSTNIVNEFAPRLLDMLFINMLGSWSPSVVPLGVLLGLIEFVGKPADQAQFQVAHIRQIVRWDRVEKLFTDPNDLFRDVYGWGTEVFDGNGLIANLAAVMTRFSDDIRLRVMPKKVEEQLADRLIPEFDDKPANQLFISLMKGLGFDPIDVGISLYPVRPSDINGADGGLGISPYIFGSEEVLFELAERTSLLFESSIDLQSGVALLLRPEQDPQFKSGLINPELDTETLSTFKLSLQYLAEPDNPFIFLSLPGITMGAKATVFSLEVVGNDTLNPSVALGIKAGRILINPENISDGFLSQTFPADGVMVNFDLTIKWSARDGIEIEGGTRLQTTFGFHLNVGPLRMGTLKLLLEPKSDSIELVTSLNGNVRLGPIIATIDGIGTNVELLFRRGNLGPLDFSMGFKPPDGIGLSVDGGGFKGGGFLKFEPDEERYAGFLELEFKDKVALKAIGLLTTRLPDGSDGYSLLIIITAEFTPIQLGLGFKLKGVGGLLGLNRTALVERLRTGIKDNTLSSILFPQNIVANAGRIISDLRQVFPPQQDRFIFGPMAKIEWGTPTLITIDLGLMLEVPNPMRLHILGVVRAQIPNEEERKKKEEAEGKKIPRILQLQVNFLGVVDFETERLAFDASLYDSKLLSFTLSGDMALRFNWGANPNFLLTVGGFHPAYDPPPMALPNLQRLTMPLLSSGNPRLTLEMYFAITSNTVQFGAKLELYASKSKFNVSGFLSLDALFQLNPVYFIADIGAMLALRIGSRDIASINLSLTLSGPTPWNARGTAKLKICWFFTFKVRFNKTFGEERNTRLDDVPVLPLLQAALSNKGNWEAQIPSGRHALVSVREIEVSGDEVVADPAGVVTISQKVVPLNVTIQKFGAQQPSDGNRFAIEQVRVGPVDEMKLLNTANVQEYFAPAQFFEKSDAEKLSSPSFERYDNGVALTESEEMTTAYAVRRPVEYEVFYIDQQRHQHLRRRPDLMAPDFAGFSAGTSQGAIAESPLSFANKAKSALAPDAVRFSQEKFAVVNVSDLLPVNEDAVVASEAGAYSLMNEMISNNPDRDGEIQVVPIFEMNQL